MCSKGSGRLYRPFVRVMRLINNVLSTFLSTPLFLLFYSSVVRLKSVAEVFLRASRVRDSLRLGGMLF